MKSLVEQLRELNPYPDKKGFNAQRTAFDEACNELEKLLPGKGMQWVKASERLPVEEGVYFVKEKAPVVDDGKSIVDWFSPETSTKRWLAIVDEWLDESASPDSDELRERLEAAEKEDQAEKTIVALLQWMVDGNWQYDKIMKGWVKWGPQMPVQLLDHKGLCSEWLKRPNK